MVRGPNVELAAGWAALEECSGTCVLLVARDQIWVTGCLCRELFIRSACATDLQTAYDPPTMTHCG